MAVDQKIIPGQRSVVRSDVANATHVRGKVINVVRTCCRGGASLIEAKVADKHFIGFAVFVFRVFDIDATHPMSLGLEPFDEVMTDKSASSGDGYTHLVWSSEK
jgi:hypothetical protein